MRKKKNKRKKIMNLIMKLACKILYDDEYIMFEYKAQIRSVTQNFILVFFCLTIKSIDWLLFLIPINFILIVKFNTSCYNFILKPEFSHFLFDIWLKRSRHFIYIKHDVNCDHKSHYIFIYIQVKLLYYCLVTKP